MHRDSVRAVSREMRPRVLVSAVSPAGQSTLTRALRRGTSSGPLQRRPTVCHEQPTWRNPAREQDARRDLWQEFEETRQAGEAAPVDAPQPAQGEPAEEAVPAKA